MLSIYELVTCYVNDSGLELSAEQLEEVAEYVAESDIVRDAIKQAIKELGCA